MNEDKDIQTDEIIIKHHMSPIQIRNIHIILAFVALLFFITFINSDGLSNYKHYNKALRYMYQDDFASATNELYEIYKEYKDSDILLVYCQDVINYKAKKSNGEEYIMMTKTEPKFSYVKDDEIKHLSNLYVQMTEYSDVYTLKRAQNEQ